MILLLKKKFVFVCMSRKISQKAGPIVSQFLGKCSIGPGDSFQAF